MRDRGVQVRDDASVSAARLLVREIAGAMRKETVEAAAIVASELATNQIRYAGGGWLAARAIERDGVPGIEVEAEDDGPGIDDPTRALGGGAGGAGNLGIGLAGVRRLSFELDLDSRIGEGTRVLARLFAGPVRRRPTVTILGRGLRSEPVSGDAAGFWRDDRSLLVMLCDGLGHGALAREASDRALDTARAASADDAPEDILSRCGSALHGTRGAVVAVGRLGDGGALDVASIGNIQAGLCLPDGVQRIVGTPGFVGAPRTRPARPQRLEAPSGTTWILATDGVHDPTAACVDARTLAPWTLAQRILERGAKVHDDAMIVVVK